MTVTAMPPTTAATPSEAPPVKKSKKKLIIILVAVLALGGGGYMFMKPKPKGPPQPGAVVKLDPIQINLAADHYLRVGMALQLTSSAAEADGSKALDAAIALFSGQAMAQMNDPKRRAVLKKELVKELGELYEGDVMGVYFTEFVTQ